VRTGKRQRRVAVLGAGMLGSTLSILLARKGAHVTLFDAAPSPMSRAGRWNEGKIHLGYIYAGDRTLNTARKLIPAGMAFRPIVEDIIECSAESHLTRTDDLILTHASSVADAETTFAYLMSVWELNRGAGGSPLKPSPLGVSELSAITDNPQIVAGFRVPERSIDTNWCADRLVDRLLYEPMVDLRCNYSITSVSREAQGWRVASGPESVSGFDAVVNALWEGKSAIDTGVAHWPAEPLSYRYRLSLFMKTTGAEIDNIVIGTGPFGDIKNYDGEQLYLSWYSAGLLADGHQEHPPLLPEIDSAREHKICQETIEQLSGFFPAVKDLAMRSKQTLVRGGWVVADGSGTLSDPQSTLHQRDKFGMSRFDTYYSVNVGKYSVAPWLAARIANDLA
jgi:FAD dependent oxidoreductase